MAPRLKLATRVAGQTLVDACRWYEFRVIDLDDREPRTQITAEVVACGSEREFFGFNRAMHAVLEAAILATRLDFLSAADILADMKRLAIPVEKTAGPREQRAFSFLQEFIRDQLEAKAREGRGTHVPQD